MRLPIATDPTKKAPALTPDQIIEKRGKGELTAKESLSLFDAYIREAFPETKIQKMLIELCEAEDVKYNMGAGFYSTPNWTARREGLRDILKIRRLLKESDSGEPSHKSPAKVVFNVVYTNGATPPAPEDVSRGTIQPASRDLSRVRRLGP